MTQDLWSERLSDYLDGELPPPERAGLEAHLAGCEPCTTVLAELRSVIGRARALDDREPARDLWAGIATQIGSRAPAGRSLAGGRRRFSFSALQLAAAAVALVTVSGTGAWLLRPARPAEVATAPLSPPRLVVQPASARTPDQSYDAAVADLQRVLDAGRGRLDTTTVRVVRKNLATIDSAVAEARRAVAKDPANSYLNAYLAHTMRRKIDLLRRVAALTSAQS